MRNRRTFHFGLVLAFASGLCSTQGCSIGSRFLIVNESGGEITVVYSTRQLHMPSAEQAPHHRVEPLLEAPVGDVRSGKAQWRSVPGDRLSFDFARGTATVRLARDMVLQIAEISNYGGHDSDDDRFPILSLDISGAHGEVHLIGGQVKYHFVSNGDFYYQLVYG